MVHEVATRSGLNPNRLDSNPATSGLGAESGVLIAPKVATPLSITLLGVHLSCACFLIVVDW